MIISLTGFMGCGKSSTGRELAARLDARFIDLDGEIVARTGRSIPDIFREGGEAAFRAVELATLRAVLDEADAAGQDTVLALGGGALTIGGGTLDVTNGVLTVTHGYISSFDPDTDAGRLSGAWISDRDVYAEGTLPTTGAQVVYELAVADQAEYTLTPQQLATLAGDNTISADAGSVTVEYRADPALTLT